MGESSSRPSRRISGRSVEPCTSSVNSAKPVAWMAMNRFTSTGTKGFSVTASASASVTAPRRPPQMIASFIGGETRRVSRSAVIAGKAVKITAARLSSAAPSATPNTSTSSNVASAISRGTSRAASTKTRLPAQKASWSSISSKKAKVAGVKRDRPMALITSPDATTATTPDTFSKSLPTT